MSRPLMRCGLVAFVLASFWALWIGRTLANSDEVSSKKAKSAPSRASTNDLGGPVRYLTAVSTDKPIYREGEKIYVRGVILDASNHRPLPSGQQANATIEIKGPTGNLVVQGGAHSQDSVWSYVWDVPQGQSGGEYTVQVRYPWQGYTPAKRKFDIRAYRAPRLKSQIAFLRDGYGPGATVQATLDVKRAEGGIPVGAKVNVLAQVDGVEIKGEPGIVDSKGLCAVSFKLPKEIARGEGTLALVIEDGGVVETASKTIPILLQTVDLKIYPEGGDLIAGYRNRLYIQANQPNGKPADLVAKLMSKGGSDSAIEEVGVLRTEHEGRGRFEFTPDLRKQYFLKIIEPVGIKTTYNLPTIKREGALIRADKDVYKKNQPITLQVGCTDKSYQVTLAKREVQLASQRVNHGKNFSMKTISFDAASAIDGVLTLTVWDKNGVPLAERLVFREPAKSIKLSIIPEHKTHIPGDIANLTIKATDIDGNPVSTVVGVTVTDDSVLEMIEKREQAPRLPVMVFLEPEVKDLADAQVYLDPHNPKAELATDLLLGTQGWRRFALMNLAEFLAKNGDDAKRVLAQAIPQVVMYKSATMSGMPQLQGAVAGGLPGSMGFNNAVPAAAPAILPWIPPVPAGNIDLASSGINLPRGPVAEAAPGVDFGQAFAKFDKDALPQLAMSQVVPKTKASFMPPVPLPPSPVAQAAMDMKLFEPVEQAKMAAGFPGQDAALEANLFAAPRAHTRMRRFVSVRQFAHQVRADRKPTDRVDFTETLFWNAGVKTDPKTGEAKISFGLNDSVTTFRVFADAFSESGAIGAANIGLDSIQPFYAEAKLPLEVTSGDRILLPISLVNATSSTLSDPSLNVNLSGDFKVSKLLRGSAVINADERVRWIEPIDVGVGNGEKEFVLNAKAGTYEDKVTRKISVKPNGFPIEAAFGGILEPEKAVEHEVDIPVGVASGSLVSNTAVYPTPLANMTEALERMIQDPNGCFEQTSSTSYPLTMAQQYFLSHAGVDPQLVERSREKLDAGYRKLVSFWCPDKGYEWFGQDPGHEALTAFGLLHFADMSQVRDVDQNMVTTTRSWLLKQKDGQGGFTRKRRALHSWIEDKDCSNAYILWALLETGQSPSTLKPELDAIKTAAAASNNYYVVALAANSLYLAGEKSDAKKLTDRLAAKQKTDGSVDGVTSSIVGSGGESLEVEGTALATLAWMRDPSYAGNVERGIKFLADSCKNGRYGSTQATVLSLRAIVTYDKSRARPKRAGKVQVCVDGHSIGDWVSFDPSTQGAIKLPDIAELLTPGHHKIKLVMAEGGPMPYSLAVKYNAITPASASDCKLGIVTKLAQTNLIEGASTEAYITVKNNSKDVIPNPVAIVGLPGGMEPRHDQLKELVKKGKIDAYEVLGREVVLYWRTMEGGAEVDVPLSLIAAVPGSYTGPASRAYLYYTDEQKRWVDGMHVDIAAK